MSERNVSSAPTGRTLYYFPILHSRADLGGFEDRVTERAIEKMGPEQWEAQCRAIEQGWQEIVRVINELDLCYSRCRLYQDGLPICGKELKIVSDLAQSGSHNHELLLLLINRGATLMGTESLDLLLAEYELIKRYLTGDEAPDTNQIEARGRLLLQQRDRFIAQRINGTLEPGQTGLLFLGMLHSVSDALADDIAVRHPIVRPLPLANL